MGDEVLKQRSRLSGPPAVETQAFHRETEWAKTGNLDTALRVSRMWSCVGAARDRDETAQKPDLMIQIRDSRVQSIGPVLDQLVEIAAPEFGEVGPDALSLGLGVCRCPGHAILPLCHRGIGRVEKLRRRRRSARGRQSVRLRFARPPLPPPPGATHLRVR